MNVICLKWGDKFDHVYVNRLYTMVKKNLNADFNFICYTENANKINDEIEIRPLPLEHDLDKWWWKLTLFSEQLEGVNIFFDLDVVIQNDITHFLDYAEDKKVRVVKAYWKPWAENSIPKPPGFDMNLNSSIIIWKGDLTEIWNSFIVDPELYMFMYNGIDSFLYFHHNEKINWLPEGDVYSRVYGYDKDNWYKFNKDRHDNHKFYFMPDYKVCIFNGLYGIKEDMIVIDKAGYDGFEKYWSD